MNLPSFGGTLHRQGIVIFERQGLLHHHVYPQIGAFLHNLPMVSGRRKHQHRLRMRLRGHLRNAFKVQRGRKMKFLRILLK